jgi:transposase InsO family protein
LKFALVDAEKAEYPVAKLCRMMGISRSGFYAWRRRCESKRAREDRRLRVLVREAHERSRRTYGSPRVHAELRARAVRVSRKRVVRLMRLEGLRARVRRRYKCTTMSDHDQPVAPNLLGREFSAAAPNQRWVGDTTELLVGESGSKLFLAVVLDLYSRFVVGWAVSAVNDRHLVMKALDQALRRRCPGAGLMHHSDQGSPYASEDYQKVLTAQGITCSMSRRANCL